MAFVAEITALYKPITSVRFEVLRAVKMSVLV
jgi:hypothetical protein